MQTRRQVAYQRSVLEILGHLQSQETFTAVATNARSAPGVDNSTMRQIGTGHHVARAWKDNTICHGSTADRTARA
eukprot:2515810-Rhodomonas_salina.8